MSAVTVALLGSKELGKEFGKKGTSSDVTLYNAVREGHALTLVEPTHYPEKFPPLLYAIGMADRVLLYVEGLSREVAEALAVIELFERPLTIVLGPSVGELEIRRALKGSPLATAEVRPLDLPHLREEVDGWVASPRDGPGSVRIDHAFPVKGVGAVALGLVTRGTVHAHDRMRLFPEPTIVEVRSLQVHDVDVKEATCGERVGVALRGIEADELSRGQVLAPEGSLLVSTTLRAESWTPCRYYKGIVKPGTPMHLMVGLQFVPGRVTPQEGGIVALEPDRPIAFERGEPGYVIDLDATPGPRIVGRGLLELAGSPSA